jgi:hypothetical protein
MEDAEWVLTAKGWMPVHHDRAKKLIKEASQNEIEDVALRVFRNFISKL